MWNLVCHTKGRTQTETVLEKSAEEIIWVLEGGGGGRLE